MKNTLLLLILGIMFHYVSLAQGNIIAKKSLPSVVLIVAEDSNGQMIGLGSGFFVAKNTVATNFHVIEGASRGYIKLVNNQKKVNIDGVVGIDKTHDIVLLSVSSESPYLLLGDFDKVEVGENIYAVGNPQGLEETFSQGIVSSIRDIENDKLLQITAPISPGSSGGPVLNSFGEVIGVSVATYSEGQNLNFAVPVSYLKSLINSKSNIVSLKSASVPIKNSITKKIGEDITEGVSGEKFLWDSPGFESNGGYSFSIKNNLRENISDLLILVIFYDLNGEKIETSIIKFDGIILNGLAKRVTNQTVDKSVHKLSTESCKRTTPECEKAEKCPKKYEIRIIDFKILNE